jgi:hypothetical protein
MALFRALIAAQPACVATGASSATGGSVTSGSRSGSTSSGGAASSSTAAASGLTTSGASAGSARTGGGSASASLPATQLQDAKNAVTTAQAALTTTQNNLAAATMVAPIDGVVATLPFAAGGKVSASSAVTIVGPGPVTVSVTVPATSISLVQTGEQATVSQLGGTPLPATVTTKGLLPGSSGFTVVVTCDDGDTLLAGVSATVAITVLTSNGTVLVPVSAVVRPSASSTSATVIVVNDDGSVTDTTVGLGAVGDTMAAITSGLSAGQRVELADTLEALPTTSTLSLGRVRAFG